MWIIRIYNKLYSNIHGLESQLKTERTDLFIPSAYSDRLYSSELVGQSLKLF